MNVSSRVIFTGPLSSNAKTTLLRNAQFYLLNNYESFGIATLEAMAQRLPVLGVNYDVYNDILNDGNSIRFSTLEEAVDKANILIRDSQFVESIGKSRMKDVNGKFTWESVMSHIEKTYRQVSSQ